MMSLSIIKLGRLILALTVLPCLWSAAHAQHFVGVFPLTGQEEVPPNGLFVNGGAIVLLDGATSTLSWRITHSLSGETAAHIHGPAPVGANAGVQVPLPLGNSKVGSVVVTPAHSAQIAAGLWYINIQTGAFPGGAIRGQIKLSPAENYVGVFSIDGDQEVPASGSAGSGMGQISLDMNSGVLDWDIDFSGLGSVQSAAHFHGPAVPGMNAGVQVDIGVGAPNTGSVVLNAAQTDDVVRGLWYVNIHSTMFPSGELRGQLLLSPKETGRTLCNGDGGNQSGCTDCPCMNNAPMGTIGGCLNSAGTGTRLNASGYTSVTTSVGPETSLRFSVTDAPPGVLCVLNSGDAVAPDNSMNPCFGLESGIGGGTFDGLRCAVQNTQRNGGRGTDVNGEVGKTNQPWGGEGDPPDGLASFFGFVSGQTRYFQVIHRDNSVVNCMTGLNTSQAVEIMFKP